MVPSRILKYIRSDYFQKIHKAGQLSMTSSIVFLGIPSTEEGTQILSLFMENTLGSFTTQYSQPVHSFSST